MKKKLAFLLIFTGIFSLFCVNTMAYEHNEKEIEKIESMEPYAEQFEWYYRQYEGKTQKRLWSVTYSRWVTDWIDC
ncbi:hypothetical protein [Intestinimonas sp. MSJ-38]|uniref:hypothetical protein n=1 Tax=Intestinimonas sp. MSJ-38 TaxID=2841532 RepID=UPI001C108EF7|nr:hypothetical protein [Intestinimonas sp. MSJ-38]MBU5432903.1 hypothetical protein [Intestinimonas sp. MSJ-38]